jgi:DNA-binding CsgD family transcriptional regulator
MEVLRESPRFVVLLHVGAGANAPSYGPSPCPLTARERDVLRLIAKGYQAPEVADVLGLSRHTVRGYVRDVYRKLGISSRAEATMEAVQRGLVR